MARLSWIIGVCLCAASACAQAARDVDKEPVAILELGAQPSWNVKGGSSFGPTAAIEFTPIEKWLEIEAGVTPLFSRHTPSGHSVEWDTDVLFKKPWTLSKKVEFMIGVGPEWIHTRQNGVSTNSAGVEGALDFMFWLSKKHPRIGWYLEPAFDYTFRGHEKSIGVSGGLLIKLGSK